MRSAVQGFTVLETKDMDRIQKKTVKVYNAFHMSLFQLELLYNSLAEKRKPFVSNMSEIL